MNGIAAAWLVDAALLMVLAVVVLMLVDVIRDHIAEARELVDLEQQARAKEALRLLNEESAG